ncbi:MAG: hypothetical protein AB1454_08180 [Candidatus Auribacterota bacterium]
MFGQKFRLQFSGLILLAFLTILSSTGNTETASEPRTQADSHNIFIPSQFGQVDTFNTTDTDNIFFLINDFHYNYQAQRNIANIIDYLVTKKGYSLVLTEGGAGNLNLAYLRAFAPAGIRKNVSDNYLKSGKISGEEYLDIVADYTFLIEGLENPDLYAENVQAFLDSLETRQLLMEFVGEIENTVSDLKNSLYPAELLAFEKRKTAFETSAHDIADYSIYLTRLCHEMQFAENTYTAVNTLASLTTYFSIVQDDKLRTDIIAYCTHVRTTHPDLFPEWDTLSARLAVLPAEGKIEFVSDIQKKSGIDTVQFPYLHKYIASWDEYNRIDIFTVLEQIKSIESSVYENVIKNPDAWRVRELSDTIALFKSLLELRLTKTEYTFYKSNISRFQPSLWVSTLSEICENNLVPFHAPDTSRITFGVLESLDKFYQLASRRDELMLENARTALDNVNARKAIIIVGGFHRDAFINYFKKENLPYAVVSPNFTDTRPTCDYAEIFSYKSAVLPQYLDMPATKGTVTETDLATALRSASLTQGVLLPQLQKAVQEGRALVIKNLPDADLDAIFNLPPDELAVAVTSAIEDITSDQIEFLASRLRGPPGEEMRTRLKNAFALIKSTLKTAKPAQLAEQYMVLINDPADPFAYLPQTLPDGIFKHFPGSHLAFYGLRTVELAMTSEENQKRFRRILFRDGTNLNSEIVDIPKGNELREMKLFWRNARVFVQGVNFREYSFRNTVSNSGANFLITDENDFIIIENIDRPTQVLAANKEELMKTIRVSPITDRARTNVALLPFFADGVGSSIRWLHAIRGIRQKHPDEYLSIVLFDIPQNRNFTLPQIEEIVDEVIWIEPVKMLVGDGVNILSHYRVKDVNRVMWEALMQEYINSDPSVVRAYPFELFVPAYDFSVHHPELEPTETTAYATSYFNMNRPVELPLSEKHKAAADQFYKQLGFNPEEEIVIAYSLRMDINLTDATRNSNMYDTMQFISMLREKVRHKTGKSPKIIFFGNSPAEFADQLLDELARLEPLTDNEMYIERIRSLTFDLVNAARELQELIDSQDDLIDFTNAWKLKHNKFKKIYSLSEQAAILERAAFATGTNSGALDVPLARGIPGVRLTEYHYMGYNEFLAKDLTINISVASKLRSSKHSFVTMVASRGGVETYLNFLASTPIQNNPVAVSRAYDEMIDYVVRKRIMPGVEKPPNIYHVKSNNEMTAIINTEPALSNPLAYPTPANIGMMSAFARVGIDGLEQFIDADKTTAVSLIDSRLIDVRIRSQYPSYLPLTVPVYFGFHSIDLNSESVYVVIIPPDERVPIDKAFQEDANIANFLRKARKILVWDKKQYDAIVKAVPTAERQLTLVNEEIPPSIPRFLQSIPKVKYDMMAEQATELINEFAESLMRRLDIYVTAKNINIIQQALTGKSPKYSLKSMADSEWANDLGLQVIDYFEKKKDMQAVDDINFVGIWMVSQNNLSINEIVPFFFRVQDYMEIQGENITRGYGTNIFVSESALYNAYLAIAQGASIEPLAELLHLQAQIVRLASTYGFHAIKVKPAVAEGQEAPYSLNKNSIFIRESDLIADFFTEYGVIIADIAATESVLNTKPSLLETERARRLIDNSL